MEVFILLLRKRGFLDRGLADTVKTKKLYSYVQLQITMRKTIELLSRYEMMGNIF